MAVETVRIKALVSFMDVREGDESVCPLDAVVQGWLSAGLVRILEQVVNDGEDPAGPGGAEPDDAEREPGEG